MKYFLTVLLVFTSFLATSQNQKFHKAVLILAEGNQKKTGYAKVPDIGSKKVSFKMNKTTDNVDLIPSDEIYRILYSTESGKEYVLERNNMKAVYLKKSGKTIEKITKKKRWFFMDEYDDKMNLYITGNTFKINKKDDFIMKSSGQKGFVGFGYYFKRPEEKYITSIMHTSNAGPFGQKFFRKTAAGYFGKDSKMAKRIMNKEFKSDEVYDLYRAYLKQ